MDTGPVESPPVHNKEDHAVAVDHSRYASRDSSRRGPFEGVLAVLVHSIVDFSDTAGFMDRTDPFVELKVGHRKVMIPERDSNKTCLERTRPRINLFHIC